PFSRVKTYILPPATTGEAIPSPTVIFHSSFSVRGHFFGALTPRTTPSRLGPRHCGQSADGPGAASSDRARAPAPNTNTVHCPCMGLSLQWLFLRSLFDGHRHAKRRGRAAGRNKIDAGDLLVGPGVLPAHHE